MRYNKKKVKLPPDMVVGSEVYVAGNGDDIQTITAIDRDAEGDVTDVHLSGGWREPLCKIVLSRASFEESFEDPSAYIYVAIGECDVCGSKFPDSCVYVSNPDKPDSMVCSECDVKPGLRTTSSRNSYVYVSNHDKPDSMVCNECDAKTALRTTGENKMEKKLAEGCMAEGCIALGLGAQAGPGEFVLNVILGDNGIHTTLKTKLYQDEFDVIARVLHRAVSENDQITQFICKCGRSQLAKSDITPSGISTAEARRIGWKSVKGGWKCPFCTGAAYK